MFENLLATQLKITWSPYIYTYIFIIPIALRLDKKDFKLLVTVYQPGGTYLAISAARGEYQQFVFLNFGILVTTIVY